MITLYQFPTSPFCEKIRRALNFKRLGFSIVDVPRADVGRFSHVSPIGKFPAIDDDGTAVHDSSDILLYLERTTPHPPLFPTNPRDAALAHIVEDWADESLYFYELIMRLGWEHNAVRALPAFAATMPGLSNEDILARLAAGVDAITRPQGLGRKSRDEIVTDARRHMHALDAMLKDAEWLVGDALSIADIAVVSQLRALLGATEIVAIVDDLPRIRAWEERVDRIAPP